MEQLAAGQPESAGHALPAMRDHLRANISLIHTLLRDRTAILVLSSVLSVNLIIELFHIFYLYRRVNGPRIAEYFYLSNDGSIGECFEYVLTGLAALSLILLAWKYRSRLLLVASLVFFVLTLDNCLMLHENGGDMLEAVAGPMIIFGANAQDLGEMLTFATIGAGIMIALWWALRLPVERVETLALATIGIAASSALFGVGVDMIHAQVPRGHPYLREIIGFIEDSGELWILSIASLVALAIWKIPQDGETGEEAAPLRTESVFEKAPAESFAGR